MSRRFLEWKDGRRRRIGPLRKAAFSVLAFSHLGLVSPLVILFLASSVFALGSPPRNLTVTLVEGEVVLSWDAPAADVASIERYNIERKRTDPDPQVSFTERGQTGKENLTYTDRGLGVDSGTTYEYRVTALRETTGHTPVESDPSNTVSITTPGP